MKNNFRIQLFSYIVLILIISCSKNAIENSSFFGPKLIINNAGNFIHSFEYDNNKIFKNEFKTSMSNETRLNESLWNYETNKLLEITNTVELEYGNEGKLVSFIIGAFGNQHRNKIELSYKGNKIEQKVFHGDQIIENGILKAYDYSRLASEGYVIIENGNIIEKKIGNQLIIKYSYDDNNSPFSKVENFDLLQILFARRGAISIPYLYSIDELWYGKNNITRKTETQIERDTEIIHEYEYNYNNNGFPTLIKYSSNSNDNPSDFSRNLNIKY